MPLPLDLAPFEHSLLQRNLAMEKTSGLGLMGLPLTTKRWVPKVGAALACLFSIRQIML